MPSDYDIMQARRVLAAVKPGDVMTPARHTALGVLLAATAPCGTCKGAKTYSTQNEAGTWGEYTCGTCKGTGRART